MGHMTRPVKLSVMSCRHCAKEITTENPRVTANYCRSCESHDDFRVSFRERLAAWNYWSEMGDR